MSHRLRRLAAVAVVAVTTIYGPSPVRWYTLATAAPKLADLRGVDDLKTLFNQDKGKIRLVLLVSPT